MAFLIATYIQMTDYPHNVRTLNTRRLYNAIVCGMRIQLIACEVL